MNQSPRALAGLVLAALAAAACSGGGGSATVTGSTSPSAAPSASAGPATPSAAPPATTPAPATTDQEEATEAADAATEPTEDDAAAGGTRPADGEEMAAADFDAIFSEQLDAPDMELPEDEATEAPVETEPVATEDDAAGAGDDGAAGGAGASEESYGSYTVVTDDSGTISVAVPEAWSDVNGTPIEEGGLTVFDVRASSDLAAFQSTWTTPGVIVTAVADPPEGATVEAVLDEVDAQIADQCESVEARQPYEDQLYTGLFDVYSGCGAEGATYVAVGAQPADQSSLIRVQVQVNQQRDLEALDAVLQSFTFNGAAN